MNEPRIRFARPLATQMLRDLMMVQEHCLAPLFPFLSSSMQRLLMRQWGLDQRWVEGEPALLSFDSICGALQLDPQAVRESYKAKQASLLPELERRMQRLRTRSGKIAFPPKGAHPSSPLPD